jgi:hypothetical protein
MQEVGSRILEGDLAGAFRGERVAFLESGLQNVPGS